MARFASHITRVCSCCIPALLDSHKSEGDDVLTRQQWSVLCMCCDAENFVNESKCFQVNNGFLVHTHSVFHKCCELFRPSYVATPVVTVLVGLVKRTNGQKSIPRPRALPSLHRLSADTAQSYIFRNWALSPLYLPTGLARMARPTTRSTHLQGRTLLQLLPFTTWNDHPSSPAQIDP